MGGSVDHLHFLSDQFRQPHHVKGLLKIRKSDAPKLTIPPASGNYRIHMIYSEGPEYLEYVMHFLPKVFRAPKYWNMLGKFLSQFVLLSKQKIA